MLASLHAEMVLLVLTMVRGQSLVRYSQCPSA